MQKVPRTGRIRDNIELLWRYASHPSGLKRDAVRPWASGSASAGGRESERIAGAAAANAGPRIIHECAGKLGVRRWGGDRSSIKGSANPHLPLSKLASRPCHNLYCHRRPRHHRLLSTRCASHRKKATAIRPPQLHRKWTRRRRGTKHFSSFSVGGFRRREGDSLASPRTLGEAFGVAAAAFLQTSFLSLKINSLAVI